MSCCKKDVTESVQDYYGKVLKSSEDLKTTACCSSFSENIPKHVKTALSFVHEEVSSKYYGCGMAVPPKLKNMCVLDLGSGSGRDSFALSALVGQNGFITGVDMTDEQLEIANKYVDYHTKKFGYKKPNVKFAKGFIEELTSVGIEDNSIDIAISNCVINLCSDKAKVFKEVFRVLKFGGEFFFSDVYCDRVLSSEIKNNQVLWNECVSGALFWKELNKLALLAGFQIPRIYECRKFEITNPELASVVGEAKFVTVTYRLFKIDKSLQLADKSNRQVIYDGKINGYPQNLKFDNNIELSASYPITVDDRTWNILLSSRFNDNLKARKAPCCARAIKTTIVNPFDLLLNENYEAPKTKCC